MDAFKIRKGLGRGLSSLIGESKVNTNVNKLSITDLVKNKLNITFANEQEILSLINAKKIEDVIEFSKKNKNLTVITRGDKGAIAIENNNVIECSAKKNLKIVDLTGAGDLFAGGFLDGYVKGKSVKESLEKGTEMSSKIIQVIGARIR